MIKRMKNIRLRLLIPHLVITLAYPAVKACLSPVKRLLIFTDTLTIVALLLVIGGIVYAMALHGDFDISSYYLQRSGKALSKRLFGRGSPEDMKPLDVFLRDARDKREEAFNYPLFLGIVYLIAAAILAYGFLS